jgi:glycosyltransferase involved in cell wall biosynthesis
MSGAAELRPLHVWLLSPYHTGSHQAWAEGYQTHSRHRVTLLDMAGRFWKWRMQGGAVELAEQARRLLAADEAPDAVLATDMVHLPAWLGLMHGALPTGETYVPLLCYMHENQLTYPWRPGEKPDLTYAMINWLSQLAADQVLFNSRYHLESWFEALPRLLKHFPDYNHLELVAQVRQRSAVLPVGISCTQFSPGPAQRRMDAPPLIVWNQRWEYDKRPDRFFALLYQLQAAQIPFRLAVAGENFRQAPAEFEEARGRLAEHLVHWGYLASQEAYATLLGQADLVISTADHEFFGISVLEAICAGAFPLLPNRLSYPELIPAELHPVCLYADEDDLLQKAVRRLTEPRVEWAPSSLRRHLVDSLDWPRVAQQYDERIAAAVEPRQPQPRAV